MWLWAFPWQHKVYSTTREPTTSGHRVDRDDRGFQMVRVSGVGDPTLLKKKEHDVAGDNGCCWMCVQLQLQCEFYTKTFYKSSVFMFSMPTSNC